MTVEKLEFAYFPKTTRRSHQRPHRHVDPRMRPNQSAAQRLRNACLDRCHAVASCAAQRLPVCALT